MQNSFNISLDSESVKAEQQSITSLNFSSCQTFKKQEEKKVFKVPIKADSVPNVQKKLNQPKSPEKKKSLFATHYTPKPPQKNSEAQIQPKQVQKSATMAPHVYQY